MDRFADIGALVAVVETGTFRAAGKRIGVAKSVVSRRVSQLEKRLGARLLHRTTRQLSLTDAGRNFYQRAVQILADLDDAEQGVTTETGELGGVIRLAAAAVAGLGITAGPTFILGGDLREDRLVSILREYPRSPAGIHAVYPPGRMLSRRVQAFTDFLAQRFGDQPYWDEGLEHS